MKDILTRAGYTALCTLLCGLWLYELLKLATWFTSR